MPFQEPDHCHSTIAPCRIIVICPSIQPPEVSVARPDVMVSLKRDTPSLPSRIRRAVPKRRPPKTPFLKPQTCSSSQSSSFHPHIYPELPISNREEPFPAAVPVWDPFAPFYWGCNVSLRNHPIHRAATAALNRRARSGRALHPRRSIHVPPPHSRLTKTPPLTVRIAPKMILGVTRSNFRRKMADMPMTRRGEV